MSIYALRPYNLTITTITSGGPLPSLSTEKVPPPFLAGKTTDLSLTISPSPHSAEQVDQSDQGDHKQFIGNSLIVTLESKLMKDKFVTMVSG